jgi:hypothetical protein
MRLGTWLRYLIGDRQAILEIAADPRAVWIGLLFVFSAALARDYDGEDLLHEPWHLLIPLAASLAASVVLFALTYGIVQLKRGQLGHQGRVERFFALNPGGLQRKRTQGLGFFSAYRSFLGLFWMTAPLAWLYAIPFERFQGPAAALRSNLLILGLWPRGVWY